MAPLDERTSSYVDLRHHLSEISRNRKVSPLKGLQKYRGKPGLISLAGGLPSPAYFPFSAISADALVSDSFPVAPEPSSLFGWFWKLFGRSSKETTVPFTIPKYSASPDDPCLAAALQYAPVTGQPWLQDLINKFTAKVYRPAYSDFATLIHTGNTDGWYKAFCTLCNDGEGVLMSEWTYPSAVASALPHNLTVISVAMDDQGMRSDSLRQILSGWDQAARGGMRRPHVMYIVPTGDNPCGGTMGVTRKQEIYAICVEYDIIIVEDDPYFFLQEGPYVPKAERKARPFLSGEDTGTTYINSLMPSFLRFDYQGRVIRLDSFSKTVAPGCRLGWFTCNPMFAERLERQSETSTLGPCGFSQSLVAKLLLTWKSDGYIRWLEGLGRQYTARRDYFVDCLMDEFDVRRTVSNQGVWNGCEVCEGFTKRNRSSTEKHNLDPKILFSFIPPTSGMFVWITIHLENYVLTAAGPEDTPETKLWTALADAGVLLGPGWMFSPDQVADPRQAHFRASFSNSEFDDLKKAVSIFGRVLREFFGVEK